MRLSIELVDQILSFLQSDPVSLEACQESHPLISKIAERHQFAHVVLDDFNLCEFAFESSEFTKIIHGQPHLATYVRSIEMRLGVEKYSPELSSMLSMMTSLKEIKLYGLSIFRWEEIPEHFRQAFLDCIHLSSMEDVCIVQLSDFPLSVLNNIKTLTLCAWPEDEYIPDTTKLDDIVGQTPQLESLSLKNVGSGSLQKVIAWVPGTLHFLNISGDFAYEWLAPLLDHCSNSLTNLQLDLGSQFASTSCWGGPMLDSPVENFPFTLSALQHLEELTVCAEVDFATIPGSFGKWDGLPRIYHPIPAIKNVMKTISSQSLKFLKLDLDFAIDTYGRLPHSDSFWSSLVHLMAESPFPCVKLDVRVAFCDLNGNRGIAPDIILNSLAESRVLMNYVNQGILVITPELPVTNEQDVPAVEKADATPPMFVNGVFNYPPLHGF